MRLHAWHKASESLPRTTRAAATSSLGSTATTLRFTIVTPPICRLTADRITTTRIEVNGEATWYHAPTTFLASKSMCLHALHAFHALGPTASATYHQKSEATSALDIMIMSSALTCGLTRDAPDPDLRPDTICTVNSKNKKRGGGKFKKTIKNN